MSAYSIGDAKSGQQFAIYVADTGNHRVVRVPWITGSVGSTYPSRTKSEP